MPPIARRRREYGFADVAALSPAHKRVLAVSVCVAGRVWGVEKGAGRVERASFSASCARSCARARFFVRPPTPPPALHITQLSVLAGGAVGVLRLRVSLIAARRAQKALVEASEDGAARRRRAAPGGGQRVAVDGVFARRLKHILAM